MIAVNREFVSLLAQETWETLTVLPSQSDEVLCPPPSCIFSDIDIRKAIEGAIALKNARAQEKSFAASFWIGALSVVVGFMSIAGALFTAIIWSPTRKKALAAIRPWLVGLIADARASSSRKFPRTRKV